jgi:alpha-galactosidase/6-phospho-beta-glucosidase family protein
MEEMEVPTEHLHETIEEEVEEAIKKNEKKGGMAIAISTALMAVFAALASLLASHHADEAVIEQIHASDQWAFYQAKGIKDEILSLSTSPDKAARSEKYKTDQAEIQKEARKSEADSKVHLEHHSILARAVTLFQISIAISAIAILTKKRLLWFISLGISGFGLYFFITGIF